LECEAGYKFKSDTEKICTENCLVDVQYCAQCKADHSACEQCESGKYLKETEGEDGKTTQACVGSCGDGYYVKNGKVCEECSLDDCKQCEGDVCSLCNDGMGFETDAKLSCVKCGGEYNYTTAAGVCKTCDESKNEIADKTNKECICKPNYGKNDQGVCVECTGEFKYIANDGKCIECDDEKFEVADQLKKECVCKKDYAKNSTESNSQCVLCNGTMSIVDNGICKECSGKLVAPNANRDKCECVENASLEDDNECHCDKGYDKDSEAKECLLDKDYVACNVTIGGEQLPVGKTDKCYNSSTLLLDITQYIPELEGQNITFLHEDGKYIICNYTDEKCKATDDTCKCIPIDESKFTCKGGKCTNGYEGDKCEIDSSVMNMIVIALICIAIML